MEEILLKGKQAETGSILGIQTPGGANYPNKNQKNMQALRIRISVALCVQVYI